MVMVSGDDQTEAHHRADGADGRVVADLGPRALAAVVRLLGDVVEAGGGLARAVAPPSGEDALELESPVIPLPGGPQTGELPEHHLAGAPLHDRRIERFPSGERTAGDPGGDPAEWEPMDHLIESEGEELGGLRPFDLEHLFDPIDEGELASRGVESGQGIDREGGVDAVDPDRGRGSEAAPSIAGFEIAEGPLADIAELGIPVGLPLVDVETAGLPVDLAKGRMPGIYGTYFEQKYLTFEPMILERGSGPPDLYLSRTRPRIHAEAWLSEHHPRSRSEATGWSVEARNPGEIRQRLRDRRGGGGAAAGRGEEPTEALPSPMARAGCEIHGPRSVRELSERDSPEGFCPNLGGGEAGWEVQVRAPGFEPGL
jgi:hypothetical protein